MAEKKTRVSKPVEEAPVDVVVEVAPAEELSDVERARAAEREWRAAHPGEIYYRVAGTSGNIGGEGFNVGA